MRCDEFVEPPLKASYFALRASVVRIETQRLTGLFECQFPVPFNGGTIVNLPGVLGNLCERQAQGNVCGRLIGMRRDETARQRVHAVNSSPGTFELACLPLLRSRLAKQALNQKPVFQFLACFYFVNVSSQPQQPESLTSPVVRRHRVGVHDDTEQRMPGFEQPGDDVRGVRRRWCRPQHLKVGLEDGSGALVIAPVINQPCKLYSARRHRIDIGVVRHRWAAPIRQR